MTEEEAQKAISDFQRDRKKWTDAERRKCIKEGMMAGAITYTGDNFHTIPTMEEVHKSPLLFAQTFENKDILSMRIAEEANLRIISTTTDRSDDTRLVVLGKGFKVVGSFSEIRGWMVTQLKMENESLVKHTLTSKPLSPFTSQWLATLIHGIIKNTPTVTNKILLEYLSAYGRPYAITTSLLQQA